MAQSIAPQPQYMGYSNAEKDNAYDGLYRVIEEMEERREFKISEFQNFLKNSPYAQFNLEPNQEGVIKLTANLAPYTQLYVVAIDSQSVAQRQVNLEVHPIQKRDLTLNNSLDTEKGFTESRTTLNILKGDTHFIEDITSTEIQLIDDLTKVKAVIDELQKGYQNMGIYSEIKEIVMKWPTMKKGEKNKQYSNHHCHELNIFIYFKDPDYFQEVVKPHLSHKMEKTFIDYYLLNDYEKVLTYLPIYHLQKLNSLEKCFLIDALVKNDKHQEAQRIAQFMKCQNKAIDQESTSLYNRVFDTVLNLNMLKADEEGDLTLNQDAQQDVDAQADLLQAQDDSQQHFDQFANYSQMPMAQPTMLSQGFGFGASNRAVQQQQQQYQQPTTSLFGASSLPTGGAGLFGSSSVARDGAGLFGATNASIAPRAEAMNIFDDYGHHHQEYEEQKKKARIQFEEVQSTNEYMETHYYKQTSYQNSTTLVQVNSFWVDYAEHLSINAKDRKPFLSANFVKNANNSVSSLLTLALLDLPFEAEKHVYKTNEGRGMEIKANNNVILFKKEVKESPLELNNDILVTHRYVQCGQGQSDSAAMPEEFLTNKAYQCEVIMTNVSPVQKNFSVLYQIPMGSLPLQTTKYMKSSPQALSPYTTNKLVFHFYFPCEGKFVHFPSCVSQDGKVTAKAQTHTLNVVNRLSINKKETFRDIVQSGNKDDIIEFLQKSNIQSDDKGYNENDLLWMLKDKAFFSRVIQVFRERCYFRDTIWKFGFLHGDEQTCKEFLQTHKFPALLKAIGITFKSKLLTVNEVDQELKHLDYYPMINARVHSVSDLEQWTLNKNFKETYEKFLQYMIEQDKMTLQQKMIMIYNFQLQDRIKEAINLFKTIDLSQEQDIGDTLRIQYDYMNAYFDFFTGEQESFKTARAIVRKYEDYPITQWRMLFLEMLDQLNEYDGEIEEPFEIDQESVADDQKKQKYKQSLKKEPKLDCEVSTEKQTLTIEIANIKSISIKFYIIDAEILFSRTPFLKENTEEFSFVKPCHMIEKELGNPDLNSSIDTVTYLQNVQKIDLEIPEHLKNQNLVIEVTGEGKQIFRTYYSTQIKVNILEAYGELKVTDVNGNGLPRVYVKVFAQKKGDSTSNPFFFKDGYTDIRGKFEYAQTSGNRLNEVQKFAIFVMSDTLGSTIKECNPPKIDETVSIQSDVSSWQKAKQSRLMTKNAFKKGAIKGKY